MVFIFNRKAPSNKSGEPQIRSPAERTETPTGGEATSDIQGIIDGLRLEPGDSTTTDESVLADKTKQDKRVASGALGRAVKRHQEAGDRTSKSLDWVNRKFRRLLKRLGMDMQRHVHEPSPKPVQPSPGRGTRSEDTNGVETNDFPGGHAGKGLDPLEPQEQRAPKPGKSTKPSYDDVVRGDSNSVLERTGNDTIATALELQTLEVPAVPEEPSIRNGPPSDTVVHPGGRDFKRTFRMVIHLSGDGIAQRVSCLDTGADLDVISHRVVESLGLQQDRYQGAAIYPLGGFYEPERQVTFDWHVAGYRQTYTSTLAVLDARHSGDFDVLLGRRTIQEIGFYMTNDKVWMLSSDNEAQPQPLHCF